MEVNRRKERKMFYVYDTKHKTTCGRGCQLYINASRNVQIANIRNCGIEELDKPLEERRFVVKEF